MNVAKNIERNFRVNLQISNRGFSVKPTGKEINKLYWSDSVLYIDELAEYIAKGYCFTPFDREKENAWNKTSNVIFIDIDHVKGIGLDALLDVMKDKPTLAYNSFSSTEGDYGYRLVYVFDKQYKGCQLTDLFMRIVKDKDNFIPQYLEEWVEGKKIKRGYDYRVCNQYYNGTNRDVFQSGLVYELPQNLEEEEFGNQITKVNCTTYNDYYCHLTDNLYDPEVLTAFHELSYGEFLEKMFDVYGSELQLETPYVLDPKDERIYKKPEKYYCLPVKLKWDRVLNEKVVVQWCDKEGRNEKVYAAGILIRKIQKPVDVNELLYLLTAYFIRFINNSDGKFNKKDLLRIANDAMKADLEVEMKKVKCSSYHVNDIYCYENRIGKRQVVGQINGERMRKQKEERWKEIEKWYDPNKSDNANLAVLHRKGVKCSINTLKTWKRNR